MDRRHTKFFHHKPLLGHYTIKHKKKRGQSSLSAKEVADKDHGPVSYTHLDVYKRQTKITGRTKKEVKQKAQDAVIDFKVNGSTRFQASTISTYEELARLWWDNHKHTVKPNSQMCLRDRP